MGIIWTITTTCWLFATIAWIYAGTNWIKAGQSSTGSLAFAMAGLSLIATIINGAIALHYLGVIA